MFVLWQIAMNWPIVLFYTCFCDSPMIFQYFRGYIQSISGTQTTKISSTKAFCCTLASIYLGNKSSPFIDEMDEIARFTVNIAFWMRDNVCICFIRYFRWCRKHFHTSLPCISLTMYLKQKIRLKGVKNSDLHFFSTSFETLENANITWEMCLNGVKNSDSHVFSTFLKTFESVNVTSWDVPKRGQKQRFHSFFSSSKVLELSWIQHSYLPEWYWKQWLYCSLRQLMCISHSFLLERKSALKGSKTQICMCFATQN